MFEGIFIGQYTKEDNHMPVHEGDVVNFIFREPGRHTGYQEGKARGVVKYNIDKACFEIIVKSEEYDYNEYTESRYNTKLEVCTFCLDRIDKFPIIEIIETIDTIYDSFDSFGSAEIKDTLDELVFLRDVSSIGLTLKAKRALYSAIDIINKVKKKFLNKNDDFGIKKIFVCQIDTSGFEVVLFAKDKQEVKDIINSRYECIVFDDEKIKEADISVPIITASTY
jgi:hypothetical protein